MKALIVAETSMASSGNLIQEAKIISKSFRWLSFAHTKCDENKVVHNLTRHAINVSYFIM